MSKLMSATLIATALLLTPTNNSPVTLAGTCASNQFPGDRSLYILNDGKVNIF